MDDRPPPREPTDAALDTTFGLTRAFSNSKAGFAVALRSERALRLEVGALILAVPASFLVTSDAFRRVELIGCLLIVIAVELLNTAIEKVCDHVTPMPHPAIKAVKDMGSAAVLTAIAAAALLWAAAVVQRVF